MLHAATAATRGLLLSAVLVTAAVPAPADDPFEGREGCLVLREGGAARPLARVGTLCAERLSPCSTFMIPNSLIGLETGVVSDERTVLRWDGVRRGREEWNRDQWVGWVEKAGRATVFAKLVRGDDAFGPLARRLAEAELRRRGLLDP